ncbi:hypothetical protein B5X24_HaOG207739 [Helicoverpa armigera]|uniref:Uncharacterized protein n=1 Tax=Helicoverpa armigera TaxID=29058 RepID=A0A2W1BHF4_HELAM|nr:hypothetical protein B5X24_HaOG207739 [Helicoverpa armigera]
MVLWMGLQALRDEVIQYNSVPNCSGRQLDLVLSGRAGVSVRAGDEGLQPVDEYHPPLDISVQVSSEPSSSRLPPASPPLYDDEHNQIFKQWNFNKANFMQMYYLLGNIDWSDLYVLNDPNIALEFFYSKINDVFYDCVPIKKKKCKKFRYTYPVWYTPDIISNIKLKYALHKKYKLSKSASDYQAFSLCRAKVKSDTMVAHDRYRDRVQDHLATDPKAFWSYFRSKRGNSNNYRIVKNGTALSDQECANEFARYFHSVYSSEAAALDAETASAAAAPSAACAHLGLLEGGAVRRALARLPPKCSVGPDGIPPFVLRDCRFILCEPLVHIFNKCIETATFPEPWKLTRVVPVPKGGGGTEASDYRPVAVLSSPAKVFEAAVHNTLYEQLKAHLTDAQHGFRPGRGTSGNLLHLMSNLVPAVDAGLQVDVAYFDFRKAFDTVDSDVLLLKLAGRA